MGQRSLPMSTAYRVVCSRAPRSQTNESGWPGSMCLGASAPSMSTRGASSASCLTRLPAAGTSSASPAIRAVTRTRLPAKTVASPGLIVTSRSVLTWATYLHGAATAIRPRRNGPGWRLASANTTAPAIAAETPQRFSIRGETLASRSAPREAPTVSSIACWTSASLTWSVSSASRTELIRSLRSSGLAASMNRAVWAGLWRHSTERNSIAPSTAPQRHRHPAAMIQRSAPGGWSGQ